MVSKFFFFILSKVENDDPLLINRYKSINSNHKPTQNLDAVTSFIAFECDLQG